MRLCLDFKVKDVRGLIKKYGDIVPAVFVIILAAVYFALSFDIPITDDFGGAALLPRICAAILLVSSLVLIFGELKKKKAAQAAQAPRADSEQPQSAAPNYKLVVLTLAAITAYAILFGFLGFIGATLAYLVAQILILTPKRNLKSVVIALVTAGIVTAFVYLLFYHLFQVILPRGTLWQTF